MKTDCIMCVRSSILVFNIEKKRKHTEIEMELQNITNFLRAAKADFLG